MTKKTAEQLLDAALASLVEEGFGGSTSRAIARRAGVNQALVFYHHGSVDGLLLAALDATSQRRLAAYREALAGTTTLADAVAAVSRLHEEDAASGHMTVVSQMVAGSVSRPDLAPKVLERIEPWRELVEEQIRRFFGDDLPVADLAYAILTFYLGVNLLSHLDTDSARTAALFERIAEMAPLLAMFESAGPEPAG